LGLAPTKESLHDSPAIELKTFEDLSIAYAPLMKILKEVLFELDITSLEISNSGCKNLLRLDDLNEMHEILLSNRERLFLNQPNGSLTKLVLFNLWYLWKGGFDYDLNPKEFNFTSNRIQYSSQIDEGLFHVLCQGRDFDRKKLYVGPEIRGKVDNGQDSDDDEDD
jgi:hypothetical protein